LKYLDDCEKFQSLKRFFQHQYQEHQKSRNLWIRDWKMAEEIAKNISLAGLTDEFERKKQAEKMKYHLHAENRCGASDLGSCNTLRACKRAGVKLPEVKGLKAEKGAFEVGDIFHDDIQTKAEQICLEKKFPFHTKREIMVDTPITPRTTMESPVDIGMVTQPIVVQKWKFRDGEFEMNTNPNGVWLRVFDIKSCSDFGFYKLLNEGPKFHWKAQMHAYMKATHLKEITINAVHKEKLYKHDVDIIWEDAIWDRVVKKMQRVEILADEMKSQIAKTGSFDVELSVDDLEWFDAETEEDADDICWWSCPFSTTHEEIAKNGKKRLVLDKPCPWACQILRAEAEEKFAEGQKWWFGKPFVTIDAIDWDTEIITCHNKKYETKAYDGGLYKVSIYEALKKFTETREEE
jgi:hypothetical protein